MNRTKLIHFYCMFLRTVLILITLSVASLFSSDLYWVFLHDSPQGEQVQLSPRAQERRLRRGQAQQSQQDLQISEDALAQIRNTGVQIRHSSRFLNAVSVRITQVQQMAQLEAISHVDFLKPLARQRSFEPIHDKHSELLRGSSFDYGQSDTQNEKLQIPAIHDQGYDGSGVLIAVFDAGFYPVHATFDQLDIVAQYDFVDHEPDPAGAGHEHGINVLSALAGYSPGVLMGPAYGASFLLARTENAIGETKAEEDNWVAALEWADSLGADIVSSSVNYREFDDPSDDYPYSAMDGQTAVITQAANMAAQRGVLIVNSIGNEGPGPGSLWPPADSPLVLAVGALSAIDSIRSFSSRGPTFDGRIKPDVVSLGSNVYVASGIQSFKHVAGTSYSTPLIAGLAALLLESQPGLTPAEIIQLFHDYGDRATNPDNTYGYGIPDLSSLFSSNEKSTELMIYPNPFDGIRLHVLLPRMPEEAIRNVQVFDLRGHLLGEAQILSITDRELVIDLVNLSPLSSQLYILKVSTGSEFYGGKIIHLH